MATRNKIICMATLLSVWIAGLALSGCSKQELPDEPVVPSKPANALRFGVADMKINTRATYDDNNILKTSFENGDKIGCVIAQKLSKESFEYKVNTEWTYQDGYLILENELHPAAENSGSKDTKISHDKGEYIRRLRDKGGEYASADIRDLSLEKNDFDYAFFFYYPFIDDETIINDFSGIQASKRPDGLRVPFSQSFIPVSPDWDINAFYNNMDHIYVTGVMSKKVSKSAYQNKKTYYYPWNEFPCFASEWQDTKELSERSDFMCVKYIVDQKDDSKNINTETATYEVKLQFRKKMAAIVVNSEIPMANNDNGIFFQNDVTTVDGAQNMWYNGNGLNLYQSGGICLGKKIDIASGALSLYDIRIPLTKFYPDKPLYEWSGQISSVNYKVQEFSCMTDKKLYPYPNKDRTQFRLILPPQQNFDAKLHFRFGSKPNVEYVINLGEKLHELEENKLHIINLTPVGWDIIIRDWILDHKGVLVENEPRDDPRDE